jgi:hypothetical protein
MEILFCEQCHTRQPIDWRAGNLCIGCGKPPRSELRCGWCARMTPEGAFCRHCGFELTDPLFYGATRMLKAEGVDKFGLGERLMSLSDAHKAHFENMYNQQLAVIDRHIDDVIFCEGFLLSDYHQYMVQSLLESLPIVPERLDSLRLDRPFFDSDRERLSYLALNSPIMMLREMASIALFVFEEDDEDTPFNTLLWKTIRDPFFKIEALRLVGHWRGELNGCSEEDIQTIQSLAEKNLEGPYGIWAALAMVKILERLDCTVTPKYLRHAENGLASNDPDIRLSAAVVLEDEQTLYQHRGPGADLATCLLCMLGSPLLADVIKHVTQERVLEILSFLRDNSSPVSTPSQYALIHVMAENRQDKEIFDAIVDVLLDSDNRQTEVLDELIRLGQRIESSELLLELLIRAKDDLGEENIEEIMESLAQMPINPEQLHLLEMAADRIQIKGSLIEHLCTRFEAWAMAGEIEEHDRYKIFGVYSDQLGFKNTGIEPWIDNLLSPWQADHCGHSPTTSWHVEIIEGGGCFQTITDYIISRADDDEKMVRRWIGSINRFLKMHYDSQLSLGSNLAVPVFYNKMARHPAYSYEVYKILWGFVFQEGNLSLSEAVAKWLVDIFDLSDAMGDAVPYCIQNQDGQFKFGPGNTHWDTHFFSTPQECLGQLSAILSTPRLIRLSDWLLAALSKHPTWLLQFADHHPLLTDFLLVLFGYKGSQWAEREAADAIAQICPVLLPAEPEGFYPTFFLEIYAASYNDRYRSIYRCSDSIAKALADHLDNLPDHTALPVYRAMIDLLDKRVRCDDWEYLHRRHCFPLVQMLEKSAAKGLLANDDRQKVALTAQYIHEHGNDEFKRILTGCLRIANPV